MNIFYLDESPQACAEMHCDKHVVRMPTECAQMLCVAHHAFGLPAPWKNTHPNHPCAKWARESAENYGWLVLLGDALCKEYTYRYGRNHASHAIILWAAAEMPKILPHLGTTPFTPPPLLTRAQLYHDAGNTVLDTVRAYYRGDKAYFARWTGRLAPEWFTLGAAA